MTSWNTSRRYFRALFIIMVVIACYISSVVLTWYPHILEDALINQEIIAVPTHQILQNMYNAEMGALHMSKSSLSIYGIGKNVIPSRLTGVLRQFSQLENDFRFCQIVLVDGLSKNGAVQIMENWISERPSRRFLIISDPPAIESDPTIAGPFVGNKMPREGRLAHARNLALEKLRKLPQTDYLMVVDLDIVGWNQFGVHDGFGRANDWDVLCANGIVLHGVYRDTYAFRTNEIMTNHHFAGMDFKKYNLSELDVKYYRNVVEVSSY